MCSEAWAGRCLLTGLYVCGGVAAGSSLVAALLNWASDLDCLPPLNNSFGDPESVKDTLGTVCDVIIYGSGATCGLCVMLAVSVNCCWGTWGWALSHQVLTLLLTTLAAASGTVLTVDFMLWCHTLQNTMGTSCERAASVYDQRHHSPNMTAYYRKMEMQQVCQWAVVPFLLCAVVVCSVVMKASAIQTQPARGRYFLLPDESSPLLMAETPITQLSAGQRGSPEISDTGGPAPAGNRPRVTRLSTGMD